MINISGYNLTADSIGNIIALLAVAISITVFVLQKKREMKNKAIDVGRGTEKIVIRWAYIDYVLLHTLGEEYKILTQADDKNMKYFEKNEQRKVYSDEQLSKINEMMIPNSYNSHESGGPAVLFQVHKGIIKQANNLFPQVDEEIFRGKEITDEAHAFHRVIIDTLNKMETLCMMMNSGVADEKTVYYSINDKFMYYVRSFYYYISETNNPERLYKGQENYRDSKKMTNVIKTFNIWKRKRARRRIIQSIEIKILKQLVKLAAFVGYKNDIIDHWENYYK